MVTFREAVARLISFCRKDHRDREFDREIATHIDMASNIRAELARFDSQIVATFAPAPQIVADTLGRQELG